MDLFRIFASLDLPTLWFMMGISALIQAGVWALLTLVLVKVPGSRTALLSSLLVASGILLLPFQGRWPAFVTILLANTLVVAGTAGYYTAICRFIGRRIERIFGVGILIVNLGILAVFTYVLPNLTVRIVSVSLAIAVLLVASVRALYKSPRSEYRAGAKFLVVLLILQACLMLARAGNAVLVPTDSTLVASGAQMFMIIAAMVITFLALAGAMMMVGQRLQYDLNAVTTQLERRVAERTTELEAANQELEALVNVMAHDLRGPIRAMVGFSHLLEEYASAQLDEDSRHYVSRVKTGAGRMGQMIDDLLTYMHLSRQPMVLETVDVTALVHETLQELLNPVAQDRNLSTSIDPLPPCMADAGLLRLVFVNLLDNALKFSAPRAEAHIEVGVRDGAYFVRDNGVGFDPRYAEKLFGIFERLHGVDEFEGNGIGLAIVKKIVERHGGKVWANANLNQGATFYFTLAPA